jgi:hypothetical protein
MPFCAGIANGAELIYLPCSYRAYSRVSLETGDRTQALQSAEKAQAIERGCVGLHDSLSDAWEDTSKWIEKLRALEGPTEGSLNPNT